MNLPPLSQAPDAFDIELRMLVEAVYLKYNYDFRDYTGASQKRRILVAMREMECDTVSALQEKVMHAPDPQPQARAPASAGAPPITSEAMQAAMQMLQAAAQMMAKPERVPLQLVPKAANDGQGTSAAA